MTEYMEIYQAQQEINRLLNHYNDLVASFICHIVVNSGGLLNVDQTNDVTLLNLISEFDDHIITAKNAVSTVKDKVRSIAVYQNYLEE